jgi:rhodanese-related sulfurtransferase
MAAERTHGLPEISTEELRRRIDGDADFVLVDALSPLSFAHSRLPEAVNIPPDRVDDLAPHLIPDRRAEVVVYCEGVDCDASVQAAERLVELGYSNVRHYAEGKRGWTDAGLALETTRKTPRVRPRRS